MSQVASSVLCLFVVTSFGAGGQLAESPPDYQPKILDMRSAVEEADSIALAYPIARRDIEKLSVRQQGTVEPLRLLETETTLEVLRVFKGPALPNEIRFRHYKGDGYLLIGPPQGPSGHMGSRGIFFLRQRPAGTFRSLVDYYRTDISTPWITGSSGSLTCALPSDCIARALLTFDKDNDVRSFSASLLENTAQSRQLVGFWSTLQLLTNLTQQGNPNEVKHQACVELSKWYALEFPRSCLSLIAGTPVKGEYLARMASLREKMKQNGLSWARDRIQARDEADTARYLELLTASSEDETRALAEDLLSRLRASHKRALQ